MERKTAERIVLGYLIFSVLTLALTLYAMKTVVMVLLLVVAFGGGMPLLILGALVLLAFVGANIWACIGLWKRWPSGRILAIIFLGLTALSSISSLVQYAEILPRLFEFREEGISAARIVGDLLFSVLTLVIAVWGVYLFGFNRDVKALFSPSSVKSSRPRAKA